MAYTTVYGSWGKLSYMDFFGGGGGGGLLVL